MDAQRLGYAFAHDYDAYRRWLSRQAIHPGALTGAGGGGLTGGDLEAAVMGLAAMHSDLVAVRARRVH